MSSLVMYLKADFAHSTRHPFVISHRDSESTRRRFVISHIALFSVSHHHNVGLLCMFILIIET